MPIYDQTFRRYEGDRKLTALWWPVAQQTFRPVLKSKLTWVLLLGLLIFVVIFSVSFFAASKLAEAAPEHVEQATKAVRAQKIPMFGKDVGIRTILYGFISPQFAVLWLLILATGGGSVSTDLRHSALPLYFSRPLRPWEYGVGKVLGLAILPVIALTAAMFLVFIQYIAYFSDLNGLLKELPGFLMALLYVILVSLFISLAMVAFSSNAKTARAAGVMYLGFFLLTAAVANGLAMTQGRRDVHGYGRQLRNLSPRHSFELISEKLLKPDLAKISRHYDVEGISSLSAVVSLGIYVLIFLWLLRRNLKVVEVVK